MVMCKNTNRKYVQKRVDPKIVDLIGNQRYKGNALTSLEYFPPRTEEGVKNLHGRMDRMLMNLEPLFTDITWGAGGSTSDLSLQLALLAHQTGHVANMHLTCTNMSRNGDPVAAVYDALQQALDGGIRNIVALRGDPPAGQCQWKAADGGFACALDLVRYIRKKFGQQFNISVAGYPEGHPNAISELKDGEIEGLSVEEQKRVSKFDRNYYVCKKDDYFKEMDYLKEKVDAGADMIITQMFFDVEVFKTFVHDCRKWGIQCPIIPGLMCINKYAGFRKMSKFCKTRIPTCLDTKMESIKNDDAAVKDFGIQYGADLCRKLMEFDVDVLHFYTLNLEKVVYGITDAVGITEGLAEKSNESDSKSMIAMGSACAMVGDSVKTKYGEGVVSEIRKTGVTVVDLSMWVLVCEFKPVAYLQEGQFEKIFS